MGRKNSTREMVKRFDRLLLTFFKAKFKVRGKFWSVKILEGNLARHPSVL